MKHCFPLLLISLCLSCATKSTTEQVPDPVDSLSQGTSAEIQADVSNLSSDEHDAVFIGYVNYFPETMEFYAYVPYPDDAYDDILQSKVDSTIVSTGEMTRERIPLDIARKYLMTSGFDTIAIYDRRHALLSTAKMVRVEKLDELITGGYVAVFDVKGKTVKQGEIYYGVTYGKVENDVPGFSAREVNDISIENTILQKLQREQDTSAVWSTQHLRISSSNSIYSIFSSDRESFLTELKGDSLSILMKMADDEQLTNIFPLPFEYKGKPLLLLSAAVRESDVTWDYLAGFEQGSYRPIYYHPSDSNNAVKE
jgi:hypothetical protein